MVNIEEITLRQVYSDILRGVSDFTFEGKTLYIKHISQTDQSELDVKYLSYLDRAQKSNLKTEKARLAALEESKAWMPEDENWIQLNQFTLGKLLRNRETCIPEQREELNKEIERLSKEFDEKTETRRRLVGPTADAWADKKLNQYHIYFTVFKDKTLKKRFFTNDNFDGWDADEIEVFTQEYIKKSNLISIDNIKRIACASFFQSVFKLGDDNPFHFFGKYLCELTYFQIHLFSWAKDFKFVFSQGSPPPDILDNPDKIIEWHNTKGSNPATPFTPPREEKPGETPFKEEPTVDQIKNVLSEKKTVRGEEALKLAKQFFG